MAEPARRPGPDSTLADARELLVEAATDSFLSAGIELGLGRIKLSDAIAASGVARATAYRSLSHEEDSPQVVLRREVLSRLLARDSRQDNRAVVEAVVLAEIEAHRSEFDSELIAERTQAVRRIIRVGAGASYHAVAGSRERSILTAAYGAVRSQGDHDDDPGSATESGPPAWQADALSRGEREIARLFGDLYAYLSALFGYRLKSSFTMDQFATAAAALVEGIAMRVGVSDHLEDIMRPTGVDGALEPWTLFGVAFEGLYGAFFEPITTNDPFADLSRF